MASIKERSRADGTIAYRVMFRLNGALVGETLNSPEGAEEFKQLVERIGGEAARRVLAARNSQTRTVLLSDWLEEHIDRLTGVTAGTRKDYRALARRHIIPALGHFPLEAIDRRQLEAWVNQLTPTMSGKTLRNVHSLLSAALNRAVYEGMVPANLAKGVRLPPPDHRKVEMVVLTEGEFTRLQSTFPAHWQPLVTFMVGTGMRWGEASALMVGSVDLDAEPAVVHVQQAWKRTGKSQRELGPPKTRKGRRDIQISRSLANEIRPLVDGRPADAFVFTSPEGAPVDHAHFHERVWTLAVRTFAGDQLVERKWVKGPGKRPRIHDLRHTYATWMAKRIPLDQLQRLLGHESIQTTVDVYGHARPGDAAAAARAVQEVLAGVLPEVEPPPPPAIEG